MKPFYFLLLCRPIITICLIWSSTILTSQAQPIPELLHYKFNEAGVTQTNYASNPPAGTATATIMGGITQGGSGQCNGALVGSGVTSTTDFLDTQWATNLPAGTSWTIAFWSSGISSNSTLYYVFGDITSNSFRCFTNGVAGANNWIMRGGGLTDILLPGGALTTPTLNAFVYDHVANEVRAYLNGTLVNTVAQTTPNIVGAGPLKVMGYDTRVGAPAGGLLDEFRVYNRALSGSELTSLLNVTLTGTDTQTACSSFTWIDGNTYTSSNTTATHTILAGGGHNCDSIVTLNLTITNPGTSTDVQTACGNFSWIDGNTYTTNNNSATYTYSGAAANGCDSIVTLDLTILQPSLATDTRTSCGDFTWIDGNTYTSSNNTATYSYSNGAANGCDSVVTLDLTINQPTFGTDVQQSCGFYTWIDGNTYTSSNNTATYSYSNGAANGCDSIVTLDLTINQPAFGTDVQQSCGFYTWIDGNTYLTNNNTATHTFTGAAANGCDSIVQLNLTILQPATGTDTQNACGSYTWIDGNTYFANNNSATHTLSGMAANGCDSTVTLNLTITQVDPTLLVFTNMLSANQSGATYQWIDCNNGNNPITGATNQNFTPTTNGNYGVQITYNGCTTTSNCINMVLSGLNHINTHTTLPVFPNPTDDKITIDLREVESEVTVRLYTLDGKLLLENVGISAKTIDVSLRNYTSSLYFLVVTSNETIYTMKLSKL